MQGKEKLGIAAVIILIIILAISVLTGQNATSPKTKIDCETACYQTGGDKWTFPAIPGSRNTYDTKGDCVSDCQAKLQR